MQDCGVRDKFLTRGCWSRQIALGVRDCIAECGVRKLENHGIYADQQNNAYILEFPQGGIGKIDAKTGKLAFYPTPTPNARARRGRDDSQNRLWFAEYGGNGVGMFDPKTAT